MSLTENLPISGPGIGLFPGQHTYQVKNVTASAMTLGTIAMHDIEQADGDVVSVVPGNELAGAPNSVFNCVTLPTTAGIRDSVLVVVLDASIAAGGTGKVAQAGLVTAKVDGSGTTATKGVSLIATTGGKLVIAPATGAGQKVVARLMATASVTTDTTATVWFQGFHGFASHRDN